jgi:non-ribosomal peptide synthetase component F
MAEGQHYRTRLSILNDQPSRLAGPELLHHLVSPSSDEIAIDFLESGSKQRAFTYRTLHALSDKFAQTIVDTLERSHNVSSIVPVLLPQSPELYVVLLAILKAGKAFCPLGLDAPKERLKYILGDVNAGLLITDSNHDAKLPLSTNVTVLLADGFFEDDGHVPSDLPRVHTDDAAYVLYTSGSTGLPKAVSVSHRAITQSLLAHDRHIPQFVRFLQFAFPTFDVAVFEIFFPWFRGRTLVGRTRTHMLEDLPKTISTLNVDAAEFTPTVVANLLDGRASVPGLKLLLTIGEMLTRDIINEYGGSNENASMLWAMYGPTEAAIHCKSLSRALGVFTRCSPEKFQHCHNL